MRRTLVTAENIAEARTRGETEISVPYSAVVTPAANDAARGLGIRLLREPAPACARAGKTPPDNTRPGTVAVKKDKSGTGPAPCAETWELPGFPPGLYEEIRQRVLARLPETLHTHPLLDELLRKSLTALRAEGKSPAPSSGRTTDQPASQATGQPASEPASRTTGQTISQTTGQTIGQTISQTISQTIGPAREAWKERAGGALRVASAALPWQGSAMGDTVNVIDVLTDGASAFAAGYMEWERASFAWEFTRDEMFVVLSGELSVRVAGETLNAGPGDMIHLPRGIGAEFLSRGPVKVAYSACAGPANGPQEESGRVRD